MPLHLPGGAARAVAAAASRRPPDLSSAASGTGDVLLPKSPASTATGRSTSALFQHMPLTPPSPLSGTTRTTTVGAASKETTRREGQKFAANCNRFEDEVIGRGGFGVVYKGQHVTTGRIVAIKQIAAVSADVLEETEREYELLLALSHDNIVQTYAFHYDPITEQASIYMEFVAGGSLCNVITKYRGELVGLPEILIRRYTCDILHGLHEAHRRGIIHRDIKPANMLIDTTGTLKLADFGLCKQVSEHTSLQNPHAVVGTVRYMSPGAIQRCYSVASDVWAVGCSVIEMADGHPPFQNQGNPMQLLFAIGSGSLRPEVPVTTNGQPVTAEFTEFVSACLDEKGNGKYCCGELIDALLRRPFATNLCPSALPEPNAPRACRSAALSPSLAPSGATAPPTTTPPTEPPPPEESGTIVLPGGTMTATWFQRSKTRERDGDEQGEAATVAEIAEITHVANQDMGNVEEPDRVLLELISGGCDYDGFEEELPDWMRSCVLFAAVRYLAVLFLPAPDEIPYYQHASVQQTVERLLVLVSGALSRVSSGRALPALECLLKTLRSGIELLQVAVFQSQTGQPVSQCVRNQLQASAAFLCPEGLPEQREAVLDRFRFLDDRRGHTLFTQMFLLLLPFSSQCTTDEVNAVGRQLGNLMMVPDSSTMWLAWGVVEHLLQCCLLTNDTTVHYDVFFGNEAAGSMGLQAVLLGQGTDCRLRHKVVEAALVLLHAQTPVPLRMEVRDLLRELVLPIAVHEQSEEQLRDTVQVEAIRELVMSRDVYDWSTMRYAPPTRSLPQTAARRATEEGFLEVWARRASQVASQGSSTYAPIHGARSQTISGSHCGLMGEAGQDLPSRQGSQGTANGHASHPQLLQHIPTDPSSYLSSSCSDIAGNDALLATIQAISAELAAHKPPSEQFKYGIIFQNDPEISWDTFFSRAASLPPYSALPRFNSNFGHLFPLVRYLVQCEGNEPELNAPRDSLKYETDWKPFSVYFPFETMFADVEWLNMNRFLLHGGHGKQVDEILRKRERGHFLIRPSKREPGKLALSAVAKTHSGRGITHKIIFYLQEVGHLVVDAFPVTRRASTEPINGVCELVRWLLRVAPDDFHTGCGEVLVPETDFSGAYYSSGDLYGTGDGELCGEDCSETQ